MISTRQLDCIFTTNFDHLVEDSATVTDQLLPAESRAMLTVAAIDSAERARRCLAESDWPLLAKLHGDYQSTGIKNIASELAQQDQRMREVLVESCKRFGLVVVGYSGRDASVMAALESVFKHPSAYPGGLYWVTSSRTKLLPAVVSLLENAHLAGVDVSIVEAKNFDELAAEVVSSVDIPDDLRDHVMQLKAPVRLHRVKLPDTEAQAFPVLRFSALPVEDLPRTARRVVLAKPATNAEVRAMLKESGCRAIMACLGRELAVFGRDAEVLTALEPLGASLDGTFELDPMKDSWAMGLVYDALVKALARRRPLLPRFRRSGHALVVAPPRDGEETERAERRASQLAHLKAAYERNLTGSVPKLGFPYQEGVHLRLEFVEQRWWCGFEPFTFVDLPREDPQAVAPEDRDELGRALSFRADPAGEWRREQWARKYNREWARIIGAWAELLATSEGGRVMAYGLKEGEGIDASFNLSTRTGWSRPSHHHVYFDRTK